MLWQKFNDLWNEQFVIITINVLIFMCLIKNIRRFRLRVSSQFLLFVLLFYILNTIRLWETLKEYQKSLLSNIWQYGNEKYGKLSTQFIVTFYIVELEIVIKTWSQHHTMIFWIHSTILKILGKHLNFSFFLYRGAAKW